MFRVLIADDEPLARRALQRLLRSHADTELVGEADSLAQTIAQVEHLRPDIVLLDINLGDGDGFRLFATSSRPPLVIFVTAHAEYAVDAFAVEAVDYLLKPVPQDRFDAALERARRQLAPPDGGCPMIDLRTPGRIVRTMPSGIVAVLAEGDFSRIHFVDQPPLMILRSIGQLEAQLPTPPFLRLGRSIMVNTSHIRYLTVHSRDEARLTLGGMAEPVMLGRAATSRLKTALSWWDRGPS